MGLAERRDNRCLQEPLQTKIQSCPGPHPFKPSPNPARSVQGVIYTGAVTGTN